MQSAADSPFDWTSRRSAPFATLAGVATTLTVASIAAGFGSTDALNGHDESWMMLAFGLVYGVMAALAASARRLAVANAVVVAISTILSGGFCCLGSVGVESSDGASEVLTMAFSIGILPGLLAAGFATIGSRARTARALGDGEWAVFGLGLALSASGAFGIVWAMQVHTPWVAVGTLAVGLALLTMALRTVLRWRAWLASLTGEGSVRWRFEDVAEGSADTDVMPWFAVPPNEMKALRDTTNEGEPFREALPGVALAKVPSVPQARSIVRDRFVTRIAALAVVVAGVACAVAYGGVDQVPPAVQFAFSSTPHQIDRFGGYDIEGLTLWDVSLGSRNEGGFHEHEVIGWERRARRIVRGPELFRRAGRRAPRELAQIALDTLVHPRPGAHVEDGSTDGPVHPPSIDQGRLVFWASLPPTSSDAPSRIVIDVATGAILAGP